MAKILFSKYITLVRSVVSTVMEEYSLKLLISWNSKEKKTFENSRKSLIYDVYEIEKWVWQ